ncbi:MAG: MBL fold metallo-hydrolase [Melioribacteraceae bacterium]|nr:MBL fold metallo-hydrolase [Melioribacteraceae bacterium]
MIKFIPLGGAEEIGASCFYLNIDGTGILLDCGIHPQKTGIESLPDFDVLKDLNLDYVILSHAHQDHIGALPFLVSRFPHVRIIATPQTIEIADLTLHNAVNILNDQLSETDSYTHEDVDLLLRSVYELKYLDTMYIKGMRHYSDLPIRLNFYDAGHIIGSASVLLEYKHDRILYTGDIKLSKQKLLAGAILPEQRVTTLITETTYGSTDTKKMGNLKSETRRFVKSANKILAEGGSILIPVFALGKMQEIFSIISGEIEKGRLTDVPIYTGGIGEKISKVYDNNRYKVNYVNPDFRLSDIKKESYFGINDLSGFGKTPSIVIASSGMILPGTFSYKFAKFWLKQKSFGIFIVGYMDEETPGFRIAQSSRGDIVMLNDGEEIKVECTVEKFFFPTHSNREEIIEIFMQLNPSNVIMVHGEEESKNWIGHRMLEINPSIRLYASRKLNPIVLRSDAD